MTDYGHMAGEDPGWRSPYTWDRDDENDDIVPCWYCGRRGHIASLDDVGVCPDCSRAARQLIKEREGFESARRWRNEPVYDFMGTRISRAEAERISRDGP